MMIRATVRGGAIVPLEPLPAGWADGLPLLVEAERPTSSPEAIDRWLRDLEAAVAKIDPEDARQLVEALEEVDIEAKAQARREMGL